MKTANKASAYPHLRDHPSHREALAKLSQFRTQLQSEQEKLNALRIEYTKSINPDEKQETGVEHAIQKAEAMISGAGSLESLSDQIQTKSRLIAALEAAGKAQSTIVDQVERTLSAEAAQHFITEHKAVVKRLLAAVEELHNANKAEYDFRNELEGLGYCGALPVMLFDQPAELDPSNNQGTRAYYWTRDAREYVG
ncbi:hypothetical protein GJV26_16975 [Massilia dura]|uniref:Uncharacterized protein n=1 Tax=Pseudoduganella dura TaxID=321982 RepID=A0A6I3XCL6_9BURK|nr:hypothetical protein [Pseudoduganella dura]MUI14137.1 hypothetical protein [Pseudoduganella dura]GGX76851.1 hypothetical protein GCM10007386_05060 [Pseudoduganella dura]